MTVPRPLLFSCCLALAARIALPLHALVAQDSTVRAGVEQLRDSLGGVTDSLALRRLEAATIEVAKKQRDDPVIHLRLGFIAYRLGEIANSKSHYDDGAGEFEWASQLRPDWPYPWYGLGLCELAQGEHSVIAIENIRQQLGKDYLTKAAQAFARATQADPSFAQATIDLASAALSQRIQPRLQVALQAVRLSAASPAGRTPGVQLARGRVEREVGEADSAIVAFHAYLAVGGDSGLGLLELARTEFYARRPAAGAADYFAGARVAAGAALDAYRTELTYVASTTEVAAFDSLRTPAARATWLERFWRRRDVVEAREAGERLAEHYRRWFYARRNFRLVSRHRHYDITERFRTAQAEFDDRGIIYIRHGDPDRRAEYSAAGTVGNPALEPNESWLYRRVDGNLIFHFVSRGDVQDFKLVESALDALGFRARFGQAQGLDPVALELWGSRSDLDPMYQRPPNGLRINDERAQGDRAIKVGTTTDSYRQRFDVPIDLVESDFVVGAGKGGGRDSSTEDLHVVFAVPAERLTPQAAPGGVHYALRFRLFLTDLNDSLVAKLDTLRVFAAPAPLRAPAYLTGTLGMAVPPGRYRYRLLVATADNFAGEVLARDSLEVAPLNGRRFEASDLVVGRQGSGLVWTAGTDTVLLNPLERYPQGSTVELYYEVYGLAPGAPYHTVVRLQRAGGRSLLGAIRGLFGGGRPPVLLEFDAPADGPVTRVHRAVDLRDVSKARYVLSVSVTDPATGRTLTRERRFEVVARP